MRLRRNMLLGDYVIFGQLLHTRLASLSRLTACFNQCLLADPISTPILVLWKTMLAYGQTESARVVKRNQRTRYYT